MNEKRQSNFLFAQPKEKLNTNDLVMRIISLKRKAIESGHLPMVLVLAVLENSINSQKNLSNKVLKSTMLKLALLEAELNRFIVEKNGTINQKQR